MEIDQIKGTQGSVPSWQSSSSLVSCSSCGGGTSSNLSYSANGDGGNVFGLTKLIQGGGQVLPFGLQIYFSTHDATVYGGMAIGALKTNFHMKINGAPSGYINVQNPTTTADIIEEDGSRITFTRSGSTWTPPAGRHETLADRFHAGMMGNIFDGYTYTRTNQMQYIFDYKPNAGSQGVHPNRLASIKDPNNNTTTVAYTGTDSFTIDSATDHAGRVVDWQYPETNLTTITDWASRVVKLDGRTSNQWKIIDASNNTATLNTQSHGNPNPTAILINSFVDALGNTYTFSYDTSQTKPPITGMTNPGMGMGSKSVSYGTDGQGNKTTTITDEEGHKRRETYHATTKDLLKIEVEFTPGTWTTIETRTYDSDHNLLSRTNALNKTWDMTYDTRGNLLTLSHPSVGGAPRAQTSNTHDSKNNRLTFTNELGKQWKWEYDANSNMTSEQDPVQAAAMPPVKTTYTYNANGTRVTMTNALGIPGQDLDIRS